MKLVIELEFTGDTEGVAEAIEGGIRTFCFSRPYKLESIQVHRVSCPECKAEIDPTHCWCGVSEENHTNPMQDGHFFIPEGCRCYFADGEDYDERDA